MADALAALRGSPPAATVPAAAAAKGKGKGKGEGIEDIVNALIRVVISHERSVHTLEDRCSFAILVIDETVKTEIEQVRDAWRVQDRAAREAREAAREEQALGTAERSMETSSTLGSQRAVIHSLIFEKILAKIPEEGHGQERAAATLLKTMPCKEVENACFRLKPRHDSPKPKFVWMWGLMLSVDHPPQYVEALHVLCNVQQLLKDYVKVAPQRSQDGPTVQWLATLGSASEEASTRRPPNKRRRQ